jgi:dienelactone hydrolase
MKTSACLAVAALGIALFADAQQPAAVPVATNTTVAVTATAVAMPSPSHAIALYSGKAPGFEDVKQQERWERLKFGNVQSLIVRNVTNPTLTPYLPDPKKATGAAVIVAPGGAFVMEMTDYEGSEVARWLADHGIAAFVLKYRLRESSASSTEFAKFMSNLMTEMNTRRTAAPRDEKAVPAGPARPAGFQPATDDGLAAVRLVRSRAKEWSIDPLRVGFVGFSAGAFVTLGVGLASPSEARPNFIAPIYGPLAKVAVPPDAPPLFSAIAADDGGFMANADLGLIKAYKQADRSVEFHLYASGAHGFGMHRQNLTSDLWIDEFYAWMKAQGFLGHSK